jgi:inositol oxygenase
MSTATVISPTASIISNSASEELSKNEFRNYVDSSFQDRVSRFYFENHKNQTLSFVINKKEEILKLNKRKMSIFDAIELLNEIFDDSDPDTEYPQIVHLLQTGEAIRQMYPSEEYDWFHLVGFLHDLGKILSHPKVFNEPQWAVVGDTFPVGCSFSDSVIFKDYFIHNPDSNHPVYSSKLGIYHEGIGLDNVHFSWGHDEYLYQVCVRNGSTLPSQGLFIIRYHSCYAIHQKNEYSYLMNDSDRQNLKWLKEFQKFDLYSKLPQKPNVDELLPYYKKLIEKYFPATLDW